MTHQNHIYKPQKKLFHKPTIHLKKYGDRLMRGSVNGYEDFDGCNYGND